MQALLQLQSSRGSYSTTLKYHLVLFAIYSIQIEFTVFFACALLEEMNNYSLKFFKDKSYDLHSTNMLFS